MKCIWCLPVALFVSLSPIALAQAGPKSSATPPTGQDSQPDRESLAAMHRKASDLHKKIGDCYASDRPITECEQQMAAGCTAMMNDGGMGMSGGMMGRGRGGMMGKGMGMRFGCPIMGGIDQGASNSAPETPPKK